VNTALGVSSPLIYAINNAVGNGSRYVATNVVDDQNATHCLRCHVQSQSYYGLASQSSSSPGYDPTTVQYIYNALNSGQYDNGMITAAYTLYEVTPTSLALWALTQAPDKVASFETKYKAGLFLQSHAQTSSAETYWAPDYNVGWWANDDSTTMMAVKGYVDILNTAQTNSLSGINDYSPGTAVNIPGAMNALKTGPDGALYALIYASGQIARIDPATNAVTYPETNLPFNCEGILPVSANEFYATCPNELVHILPDGTQQVVQSGFSSRVYDVVADSNGTFYISDFSNNEIFYGPAAGPFVPYVSGGLLNEPGGLAVGADGSVYVANYGGFNILKIAPGGTVSVFADGLTVPPIWLTLNSDGSMYASHPYFVVGEPLDNGLLAITSQGVARRLFSLDGLLGVAVANGTLYMATQNSALYPLVTKTLDTSQLTAYQQLVTGSANYFLAEYADGNTNNILQASRMIGLAEAAKVITDQSLLGQINTAISSINTLLRSRQNSDGGWGATPGSASDAIVTSLVGLGLNYLSPPTSDTVVQNAVQFLLNSQNADGSWLSADQLMQTDFAATGLVMAYLPQILNQYGGINVTAQIDFPSNVTLSNPSIAPTGTVADGSGGELYTWALPGVNASGTALTFDLTLANLVNNQTVPVANSANLLSANSFDGSQVSVSLTIPSVTATDGLALTAVSTDQSSYNANALAQLTAQVSNTAAVAQSGSVTFTIEAPDGSVVTLLTGTPFSNLGASQSVPVSTTWSVGTLTAGTYTVVANLYDSTGSQAGEQSTSLVIASTSGANGAITLSASTNQQSYNTTDSVSIGDLVQDVSVNTVVDSASLQITVTGPAGTQVYSTTTALGELTPGYVDQLSNTLSLSGAAQGTYTVQASVVGNGQTLATASAQFQVAVNQPGRGRHPKLHPHDRDRCIGLRQPRLRDRGADQRQLPAAGERYLHGYPACGVDHRNRNGADRHGQPGHQRNLYRYDCQRRQRKLQRAAVGTTGTEQQRYRGPADQPLAESRVRSHGELHAQHRYQRPGIRQLLLRHRGADRQRRQLPDTRQRGVHGAAAGGAHQRYRDRADHADQSGQQRDLHGYDQQHRHAKLQRFAAGAVGVERQRYRGPADQPFAEPRIRDHGELHAQCRHQRPGVRQLLLRHRGADRQRRQLPDARQRGVHGAAAGGELYRHRFGAIRFDRAGQHAGVHRHRHQCRQPGGERARRAATGGQLRHRQHRADGELHRQHRVRRKPAVRQQLRHWFSGGRQLRLRAASAGKRQLADAGERRIHGDRTGLDA
jgi:hypothetical protein